MDDLWDKVREAAAISNQKEMVSLLYQSGFLDGLERTMHAKWRKIPREDLDCIVIAAAVDDLYEKLSQGEFILNPGGYIYKTIHFKAVAYTEQRNQLSDLHREFQVYENFIDPFETPSYELDRDYCLNRALVEVRKLLNRLGQENVQSVMAYVFDCIEAKRYDVTPAEISGALGLSSGTVRTSLSRGFKRLKRIAMEDNLAEQILSEAELITDIEDEEEVV